MKHSTSIRSWAARPDTATTPLGHNPLIPETSRPSIGAERVQVFAHRAAGGNAPENTLAAVREALALGVDWIEVDVWQVDGELVVIHDQRVDRTTNGVGYVQDFSLHDLRMLDAGCCQRIPLLEEVIALIDGRCGINIELKGPDCADAAVDTVNASIRSGRWRREQFLLSSFDHAQLARVSVLDRRIRTGMLLCGAPENLLEYAQKMQVWSLHFSLDFVRSEWIKAVQSAGIWAFVYTVNDYCDLDRVLAMGVDGVFSDKPEQTISINADRLMAKVA